MGKNDRVFVLADRVEAFADMRDNMTVSRNINQIWLKRKHGSCKRLGAGSLGAVLQRLYIVPQTLRPAGQFWTIP